jgi:CubicO group peptidase (beta-lactamase class C family)
MPSFSHLLVACAAVLLWLAPPASAISAADRRAIVATLTPLFEQASEASSLAFSLGLADGDGAFGVAASPPTGGGKVDGSSRYPMGSVTKTWSTVAALRLAERGVLDLDEPISAYVDPWLEQRNGTTLAQLWSDESAGGGASASKMIATVTARQLMAMRSGVADYPYSDLQVFALSPAMRGAGHDITPYDYLHAWTPKHFDFAPDTGGSYSYDRSARPCSPAATTTLSAPVPTLNNPPPPSPPSPPSPRQFQRLCAARHRHGGGDGQ